MRASNKAELVAMLMPAVKQALTIVGEDYMKPVMETDVNLATGRGDYYVWGSGAGSLSQAWEVFPSATGIEFRYDSSKLVYDARVGKHITPAGQYDEETGRVAFHAEKVSDMASLIDLGLGGRIFGNGNPTQTPTHFWDTFIDDWRGNRRNWIITGLEAVGLPVRYKGFV